MNRPAVYATTEPLDVLTYGLYLSVAGRYITIDGASPEPIVRTGNGKQPLAVIALDRGITTSLRDACQAVADALNTRLEYLGDTA